VAALPPFGRYFYPYDLSLDEPVLKNENIAFNAIVLTKFFILKTEDYQTNNFFFCQRRG